MYNLTTFSVSNHMLVQRTFSYVKVVLQNSLVFQMCWLWTVYWLWTYCALRCLFTRQLVFRESIKLHSTRTYTVTHQNECSWHIYVAKLARDRQRKQRETTDSAFKAALTFFWMLSIWLDVLNPNVRLTSNSAFPPTASVNAKPGRVLKWPSGK